MSPIRLEDWTCGVCMGDINEDLAVLDCNHVFCRGCITTWFRTRRICPACCRTHDNEPCLAAFVATTYHADGRHESGYHMVDRGPRCTKQTCTSLYWFEMVIFALTAISLIVLWFHGNIIAYHRAMDDVLRVREVNHWVSTCIVGNEQPQCRLPFTTPVRQTYHRICASDQVVTVPFQGGLVFCTSFPPKYNLPKPSTFFELRYFCWNANALAGSTLTSVKFSRSWIFCTFNHDDVSWSIMSYPKHYTSQHAIRRALRNKCP